MKNFKKIMFFTFIVSLLIVATGCGKKINLSEYYDVEIYGMNGYGKVKVNERRNDLASTIAEAEKVSMDSFDGMLKVEAYFDRIKYTIEPLENIKNGDTVVLKFDYKKGDKDKANIVAKDLKIKVKDLPEGTEVDLFKDIEVEFSGVSPNGLAKVNNKSEDDFIKNVYFKVEPSFKLKVGDKVTVTAQYSENDAMDKLYIIKENQKEYVIEKLDTYLDKADKVDKSTKDMIIKESKDIMDAYISRNLESLYNRFSSDWGWANDGYEYKFDLVKSNLLVAKEMDDYYFNGQNKLVIFYDVKITNNKKGETSNGFIVLEYSNIIVKSDGKIEIHFSDANVSSYKESLESVEREKITGNKDKYTIEDINLKSEK